MPNKKLITQNDCEATIFKEALEASSYGIVLYDSEDRFVYCNQKYKDIHKAAQAYLYPGNTFENIIRHATDAGAFHIGDKTPSAQEKWIQQRLLRHRTATGVFEQQLSSGQWIQIEERRTQSGGIIGSCIYITDIKQKEINLKQKLEFQSALFESLEGTIFATDGNNIIYEYNNNFLKTFPDQNPIGQNIIGYLEKGNQLGRCLAPVLLNHVNLIKDKKQKTCADEFCITTENGQKTYYHLRTAAFMYEAQSFEGIVATLLDISQQSQIEQKLRQREEELESLAYYDRLTGLPNRTCFQRDITKKFAHTEPEHKFAIVHLDLDNFKRVNDTMGHSAGDQLLAEIGYRLKFVTTEFQNVASYRLGGDEFIIIIERKENFDLDAFCQELTDQLSIPLKIDAGTLWPTASLGIARYPEDGTDFNQLMIYSDLALYRSKELGRDNYHFFTREMKENIDRESHIEAELRRAIQYQELFLVYQPQIDLNTYNIKGVEALIRWDHPEKGVIIPSGFLHIVETTGLAPIIGRFVINEALAAARRWLDNDINFGRIAINLSPRHLKMGTLFNDFLEGMQQHNVDTKYVTAEVVESIFLDDPKSDNTNILSQLHDIGVHIELDDFGTGYGSLSHLSSQPIDGFKIDKTFISKMLNDTKKEVIVKLLIDLTKLLRISVVCEGVETEEQITALKKFGNCSIQGYFIAKPMPFEDMTEWLRDWTKHKAHQDFLTKINTPKLKMRV